MKTNARKVYEQERDDIMSSNCAHTFLKDLAKIIDSNEYDCLDQLYDLEAAMNLAKLKFNIATQ